MAGLQLTACYFKANGRTTTPRMPFLILWQDYNSQCFLSRPMEGLQLPSCLFLHAGRTTTPSIPFLHTLEGLHMLSYCTALSAQASSISPSNYIPLLIAQTAKRYCACSDHLAPGSPPTAPEPCDPLCSPHLLQEVARTSGWWVERCTDLLPQSVLH